MPLNLSTLRSGLASVLETGPTIPLPIPQPPGTVTIVTGPGTIGFKLNGVLRWVVDEKLFGATPTLTFGAQRQGFRVELKGALYPGTQLSADFVCLFSPKTVRGTPMDISMTLGGFHATGVFEFWLAGSAPLTSPVTLNALVCELGASAKLAMDGTATASFTPNWQTSYNGTDISVITGLSSPLQTDNFSLRLMTPGEPSVRTSPKNRRTLLTVARGAHDWDLAPAPLALDIGQLTAQLDLFDQIEIEAGENSAADQDHTLVAQSFSAGKLIFAPGGGLAALDGSALTLPLANARFAHDFEAAQTFLAARFSQNPVWFQVEGFAMQIAGTTAAAVFEVDATNNNVTTLNCAPTLIAAAAPLAGGGDLAAKPLPLSGASLLHFVARPGTTPGWGVLAAPDISGRPKLSLPEFAVGVLRRDDLLALEFVFGNLALEGGSDIGTRLAQIDPSKDGLLTARFNAPQNIAEQAFAEEPPPPPVTAPPVQALSAGPSRLVFKLTAGVTTIDYSVEALLDWKQYDPSITYAASLPDPPPLPPVPPPLPAPATPTPDKTAIEVPWHLFLSPNATSGWAHSLVAVTHDTQTELWHTRLGVKKSSGHGTTVDEQDASTRKIRAIWSPDFAPGTPPAPGGGPFLMSLDTNARDQIVALSSDFTNLNLPPKAIDVDRLMLSALGGWLDVDGRWDPVAPFDLLEWRHRAPMGRDSYVKVVRKGFLVPFGHRAVLFTVTERKFLNDPAGNATAYLLQRQYIVVKEPVKDYTFLATTVTAAGRGRNFPYQQVRITTLVTPNLDHNNGKHFFPSVNGSPFLFHCVGTDREGQTSEFVAPLVWASLGQESLGVSDYLDPGNSALRKRDLAGQSLAFAQFSKPGDTSLNTSTMTFSANFFAAGVPPPPNQPPFYPILDPAQAAEVTIPALQQINGNTGTVPIQFYGDYVNNDFKKGGVFVQLVNPLGVNFTSDKTGGVATPNLNVGGLSRAFGTVSGTGAALDTFAGGTFDPSQYFGAIADTKLLGFIPLTTIIQLIADITGAPEKTPKILTNHLPTAIVTNLAWTPDVQNWNGGFAQLTFTAPDDPTHPAHLELDVTITAPLDGTPPDATVEGHLRSFDLELFSVIKLHMVSIDFKASPGKKLDFSADVGAITFEGDLSFLNTLQQIIPSNGFSDPPILDITPTDVTVGYTLAIPSVGVGVFSLENISLGAALELSFINDPVRFRFNFSERQHPFLVTVSLLGGGGFFGLSIGPDGVEILEASIEFGANVSLDLVVASANVHIMAGVYLKLDFATKHSQLTGYLRAGGSANVLGLITVSVEFYLGFTYYLPAGGQSCKIAGEASVTVEIDILFFSASVSISLRREFSDPVISFADLISEPDWDEYCDAFAA